MKEYVIIGFYKVLNKIVLCNKHCHNEPNFNISGGIKDEDLSDIERYFFSDFNYLFDHEEARLYIKKWNLEYDLNFFIINKFEVQKNISDII